MIEAPALALLLGIPLLGGVVLGLVGHRDNARDVNVAFSLGTFIAACVLTVQVVIRGPMLVWDREFYIDALNVFLVTLTAFVGPDDRDLLAPLHAHRARPRQDDAAAPAPVPQHVPAVQLHHAAGADDQQPGHRLGGHGSRHADDRAVGQRLPHGGQPGGGLEVLHPVRRGHCAGLFGTVLLYMAAEKVIGAEGGALLWTNLDAVKGQLDANIITLAFAFLFIGYGTKVGLVPVHNWLPDAHAEGPTPVSAVLSGLLLNVALYAVLRCKVLTDGALGSSQLSGRLMMGFGLLSVVAAVFFIIRQKDVKRMFAYSSIEHMGMMSFAFGLGGPVASYAGLLHMTVHSLIKSAIFFAVGHATQKAGTQMMDEIRGLVRVSPTVGWGLMLGTLAILGMPPFGVFASEFLIVTTAMREQPWATPFLLVALGLAFAAVFSACSPWCLAKPRTSPWPTRRR
jgi:hydrogenase-4 component F